MGRSSQPKDAMTDISQVRSVTPERLLLRRPLVNRAQSSCHSYVPKATLFDTSNLEGAADTAYDRKGEAASRYEDVVAWQASRSTMFPSCSNEASSTALRARQSVDCWHPALAVLRWAHIAVVTLAPRQRDLGKRDVFVSD